MKSPTVISALLALGLLGAACGPESPGPPAGPTLEVPTWAKVAPEQIAEAVAAAS